MLDLLNDQWFAFATAGVAIVFFAAAIILFRCNKGLSAGLILLGAMVSVCTEVLDLIALMWDFWDPGYVWIKEAQLERLSGILGDFWVLGQAILAFGFLMFMLTVRQSGVFTNNPSEQVVPPNGP